ncbi:hypothetical protein [Devosia sediminis]|uniref:Uncharacterized protein n=1 Tax=Devosia sediminis TaxID=2798801 RepID=A0A934IXI0_9HYPH|nr:hypothetical protein [Devosia sediminis]MBJ3784840.1 hypothetical protein [Devosia sediminis]
MRIFALVIAVFFASPALAQYWGHYANERFGYEIDVPPGFEGSGESDNGDGQVFYRLEAEQQLTVWGGHLLEGFEAEAAQRQDRASQDNWGISYQASTPQWAVFSGQRDHRVLYQRMIALCDGASYAGYALEYNVRDLAATDAVIDGLNRSLAASDC